MMNMVRSGADVMILFTGHDDYRKIIPSDIKTSYIWDSIVIIGEKKVFLPYAFIKGNFVNNGIGFGDRNGHPIWIECS